MIHRMPGLCTRKTVKMKSETHTVVRCDNSQEISFLSNKDRKGLVVTLGKKASVFIGHSDFSVFKKSKDPHVISWLSHKDGLPDFVGGADDYAGYANVQKWHRERELELPSYMRCWAFDLGDKKDRIGHNPMPTYNLNTLRAGCLSAATYEEKIGALDAEHVLKYSAFASSDRRNSIEESGMAVSEDSYSGSTMLKLAKRFGDDTGLFSVKVFCDPKMNVNPPTNSYSFSEILGYAHGTFDISTGDVISLTLVRSRPISYSDDHTFLDIIKDGCPSSGFMMSHSFFQGSPRNVKSLSPIGDIVLSRLNERSQNEVRKYLSSTRSNAIDMFRSGETLFKRLG